MSNYIVKYINKLEFLRFANADGKVWVVPIKNMRTALNLYQPSGVKGKLVKRLLPYFYWVALVRWVIRGERVAYELSPELVKVIKNVLGVDDFEFSVFEGTPSVHQKMTIQISNGDRILAYCKLAVNEDIISLFRREQIVLDSLRAKGINNIPECLYCGKVGDKDNTVTFIQSTKKTANSKVVHHWSDEHARFIEDLHTKTKHSLLFEQSDFAKSLAFLESNLDVVPQNDILAQALERVRAFFGSGEVEFYAYHADFTPWNMFVEGGELFVFDFEYAGMSYPAYMDWFHYFTQVANFEKHLEPTQIVSEFKDCKINNSRILYTSYLLDVISRYIAREGATLSGDTVKNLKFWIEILTLL